MWQAVLDEPANRLKPMSRCVAARERCPLDLFAPQHCLWVEAAGEQVAKSRSANTQSGVGCAESVGPWNELELFVGGTLTRSSR